MLDKVITKLKASLESKNENYFGSVTVKFNLGKGKINNVNFIEEESIK